MNLPQAPTAYDRQDEANARRVIANADMDNLKRRQDVRLINGERLTLKSPNGSEWSIVVSNTGVLTTEAV